jgi:hypothetical protein
MSDQIQGQNQQPYGDKPGIHPPEDYHAAPNLPGTEHNRAKRRVREPDPEAEARHEESKRKYPELSLSRGEYVLTVVRRHPIGLAFIWAFVVLVAVLTWAALFWYQANTDTISGLFLTNEAPTVGSLMPLAVIFMVLLALGGFIATIVYTDNRFYLTNESVFQFLRTGILQTKMQVISLINVEDASHEQNGILQNLFNYGTLRLSTQGEETVYHFYYVSRPRRIVAMVNDAQERAVRTLEGYPPTEF